VGQNIAIGIKGVQILNMQLPAKIRMAVQIVNLGSQRLVSERNPLLLYIASNLIQE